METNTKSKGEKKMKKCPICGNTEFHVTAHVTQSWLVDGEGCFKAALSDCDDVIHEPDNQDIWTCSKCGHEAPGEDFEMDRYENPVLYTWKNYFYETIDYPLVFVKLNLTDEQVNNILLYFDGLYGDTDQDTTVWALEFQLFTRMLLCEKALIVNPYFLDLDSEALLKTLRVIIGESNFVLYWNQLGITIEDARKLFTEECGE